MNRRSADYRYTPKRFLDEAGDCSVRAFRIAAGMSYTRAHEILKSGGRSDRRGLDFNSKEINTVYRKHGFARVKYFRYFKDGLEYGRTMLLADFIQRYPIGRFLCGNQRHVWAVVNGVVHDWGKRTTGPRTRIFEAWERVKESESA